MRERIEFLVNRAGEKLWIKPLFMCILSVAAAFVARAADYTTVGNLVPDITAGSVETLLKVISASMLVIATFAVASMVSAYASASGTATPRAFAVVVADDVSQNALSVFIGAFIFSVVALIAVQNSYYDTAGRFTLFLTTIFVFAIVILTFVRWVDRIARLGRLGTTIDKVETATRKAMQKRLRTPRLGGVAVGTRPADARAVFPGRVGYLQRIDIQALQKLAEDADLHIEVAALPGAFLGPDRAVAWISADPAADLDNKSIADAFLIGDSRTFDDDPRFGLIVLSEIASRALSPGINDPGTAIDVIGTLVSLFATWSGWPQAEDTAPATCGRVAVPELDLDDLFDDAFGAMARDGAGTVEVVVRLLKAYESLASLPHPSIRGVAADHARRTLARAERALTFPADLEAARAVAAAPRLRSD